VEWVARQYYCYLCIIPGAVCSFCDFSTIYIVFIDHPRSGVALRSSVSVCLSDDNFRKPRCGKFIFAHPIYLQTIRVNVRIWKSSGQGQGHGSEKGRNSLFPQCKTSIGHKPGSIKHTAMNFCVYNGVFGYGGSNGVTAIFVMWPEVSTRN